MLEDAGGEGEPERHVLVTADQLPPGLERTRVAVRLRVLGILGVFGVFGVSLFVFGVFAFSLFGVWFGPYLPQLWV